VDFHKHLYNHIRQSKIGICCGYQSCFLNNTIFKTVNTYAVHICRHHSYNNNDKINNFDKQFIVNNEEFHFDVSNNFNLISQEITSNQVFCDTENIKKAILQLYLNLTAKYFLTEFALQAVIDGMSFILLNSLSFIHEHFIKSLNESDIQDDIKNKIKYMFQHSYSFFENIHNSINGCLRNTYLRNIYFQQNFHIVMPVQINLGFDNNHKQCFYHYIPILNTIKVLLQNSDIQHFCLNSFHTYNSNALFDIKDGSVLKNNNFFRNNKYTLQIILYQDAFEICNPLGSAKKKFKLVGIYMVLGNLPPYLRSKVDNIQLVMLCYEKHVTFYSWEKIMERLINDLKCLENEGIDILLVIKQ